MYNLLFIYPNFSFSNPNAKQFDRLLGSIEGQCTLNVLARKGPRNSTVKGIELFSVPESRFRVLFQHALLRFAGDWAYQPDELRPLVNTRMYRVARKLVKEKHFDAIVSLSFPLSCTLIAYRLKKIYGIPWIAMFYDPWTDNQFRRKMRSRFAKWNDRRWERLVALNADVVIHTNDIIAERWGARYGDSVDKKIHVIPFCYTKDMMDTVPSPIPPPHDKIILSYIGRSVGKRNLHDMIIALGELLKEGVIGLDHFEFRVIGDVLESDVTLSESESVNHLIRFIGPLPESVLASYYEQSDCFLVIDAPDSENVFFPSKLMDYFYWRRPILGITPLKGITNDLLRRSGGTAIANGDIPSIKEWIKKVIQYGPYSIKTDFGFYKQFDPQIIGNKFIEIVSRIA